MAPFFLQSLFSNAPSHIICSSRAFYIFKIKKTNVAFFGKNWSRVWLPELWKSQLNNCSRAPSKIRVLTNLHFIPDYSIPNWRWITQILLGMGLWAVNHIVLQKFVVLLSVTPSGRRSIQEESSSLQCSQIAHSLPLQAPAPSLHFPESHIRIKIPGWLSMLFASQKSGWLWYWMKRSSL